MGGLGIKSVSQLAEVCYASSLTSTEDRVRSIITPDMCEPFAETVREAQSRTGVYDRVPPDKIRSQGAWSQIIHEDAKNALLENASSNLEKARLRAVSRPGAGAWLQALPSHPLGTALEDNTLRICVGLRLGTPLVSPHTCSQCGDPVGPRAHHGLSCSRSLGRHPRHSMINETFARGLRSAGTPRTREPTGLHRAEGNRPDGITLVPYHHGKALVWDGTVTDTLAPTLTCRSWCSPFWASSH